ncbi:MAG TPA: tRNA uridine-5-carboxymethylaminomethyl(34) synthesis GTPase MnmE [Lachnospiraceae bacterium]|nr:tRNA uridine-5-carboxymethylaminomethyl(34) synthesis GTPase MnmE [Lachnospiraceae bacterium]
MKTDTIAAIATAMTNSGIGIIRISGEDAFTVIDRIYQSKNGKKKLSEEKSHTVHYGYIVDDTKENKIIDEVMVLIMRAPNTYTREDTVEIDCHGGVLVMQKILDTVVCHGARPAEPGEFTKRAFLNGRIDLTQAESVMDVISSKNEFALKSSMSQLQGSLQKEIKELREKIIYEIAFIESALDDPEHINIDGYGQKLKTVAEECKERIEHLLDTADNGKILKEGIDTVIVGKPNAGKSSLMNVLLKKERAIVTDIAGTTRDVLEEQMNLNGITLNIIDTAGIRDTEDIVEKIGVDKAKDYLVNADLIIYVVDSSTPLDENDEKIMEMIKDRTALVLLNKSDLDTVTTEEMIASHLDQKIIKVSMKENQGVDELENAIKELFFHGKVELNDEVYITNARHKAALSNAKDSLNMVLDSIAMEMPEDFYSIDLMNTYEELGNILGESLGEDLVNEIFSKFCTGK